MDEWNYDEGTLTVDEQDIRPGYYVRVNGEDTIYQVVWIRLVDEKVRLVDPTTGKRRTIHSSVLLLFP